MLAGGDGYQPPDAPLSRGLEVHPWGASDELEIWIDRDYVPAGYGWSFPAGEEVRVGVGSFDPRHHVKEPTVRLAEDLERDPVRYQGNWIPHRLRPAAADGIFFAGDSAGPLPAADGRGHPHRALLRHRLRPRAARGRRGRARTARPRCATTPRSTPRTAGSSRRCCGCSGWCRRCRRERSRPMLHGMQSRRFVDWSFGHYLAIAPPSSPARRRTRARLAGRGRRLADHQQRPGQQQGDAQQPLPGERRLLEAQDAHPVDHDRGGELAGDRRGGDAAGPDLLTVISAVVT